jgi:mRNA-degrading endonuclease HigB of HigAB toxin-antitoxin module
MVKKGLAVKINDPKMGSERFDMRFVGQAEVATFLRLHPAESERLQAWVAEIRHRNWRSPQELKTAFRDVDAARSPLTVFRFDRPPLHIETLIDFRTNVLVLLAIKHPRLHVAQLQYGNEHRDH